MVENTVYVGWPLIALLVIIVVALRRKKAVWIAVTLALFALSCEFNPKIAGHHVSPLVFLHKHVELTASILPMRFSSVFYLAVAFLVALGVKELVRVSTTRRWVGVVGAALVLISLVSLLPGKTRATSTLVRTPAFFTSATMKQTIPKDSTVMIAPMASAMNVDAEYWQVKADFWFKQLGHVIRPSTRQQILLRNEAAAKHGRHGRREHLVLNEMPSRRVQQRRVIGDAFRDDAVAGFADDDVGRGDEVLVDEAMECF